ncbi:uncharacterized protein B0P05DRAFT_600431 [Gilbertella persicaria]|uniref:uncharacterized protein n=1 Tax=Gilbertella persicaria TaxID=101096 RepID=UPI002220607D|nr:uncharacterized protein B0P05DRAFT_600431 [Gilbertella persicaria]KAI8052622.1 hypothetical protein B0P05DRAFT_600431 [Gilbertella persicaria]
MTTYSHIFKIFLDLCEEKDDIPLLADLIERHSQHIKANIGKDQDEEYSKLASAFFKYANSRGIEAKKGDAKAAWKKHIKQQASIAMTATTTNNRKNMVLCQDYGKEEGVFGRWSVGDEDLIKVFQQRKKTCC